MVELVEYGIQAWVKRKELQEYSALESLILDDLLDHMEGLMNITWYKEIEFLPDLPTLVAYSVYGETWKK